MKKIRADTFFWVIAVLTLLPFIILSFFSHPGKEDYLLDTDFKNHGFWTSQKDLYFNWGGRFFINTLLFLFVQINTVSGYYFLFTLLLFVFTFLAAFFLLKTTNKLLLNNQCSVNRLLQASLIFLLLNIFLLADIASNFYWFSAALVYQTSVILLLVLITLFIKRFNQREQKKTAINILIILLVILLEGCNETIAAAIITILFFAAVLSAWFQWSEKKFIILCFAIAFTTGLFLLVSSGILNRQKTMQNNTGYLTILAAIVLRVYLVFYNIFKEPLFWISLAYCFAAGAGVALNQPIKNALLSFKKAKNIIYSLLLLVILTTAILTPLLLLAKGAFPERALNNIILIAAIFLLVLAFIAGNSISASYSNGIQKTKSLYAVIILGVAMLCSATYMTAWKSVCSGYFYHAVLRDRDKQFMEAKNNHQKTVVIQLYSEAIQQKIKESFPNGGFKTVSELILQPPVTIPFFNEAEDTRQPGYRLYYGVDRIFIQPDKP